MKGFLLAAFTACGCAWSFVTGDWVSPSFAAMGAVIAAWVL